MIESTDVYTGGLVKPTTDDHAGFAHPVPVVTRVKERCQSTHALACLERPRGDSPLKEGTTPDRLPPLLDLRRQGRTPADHQPELLERHLGLSLLGRVEGGVDVEQPGVDLRGSGEIDESESGRYRWMGRR